MRGAHTVRTDRNFRAIDKSGIVSMAESACSLHALANLDQQLIACFEPNQTRPRVLDIKDDVYDYHCDHREAQNVKPAPLSTNCHSITRQQRADEPEAE